MLSHPGVRFCFVTALVLFRKANASLFLLGLVERRVRPLQQVRGLLPGFKAGNADAHGHPLTGCVDLRCRKLLLKAAANLFRLFPGTVIKQHAELIPAEPERADLIRPGLPQYLPQCLEVAVSLIVGHRYR